MLIPFNQLFDIFSDCGLSLTEEQYALFDKFSSLLIETNQKFNLTSITEPYDVSLKHILDSVLPFKYVDIPDGCKLADIGSGAGFPGIPISIYRPDLKITLVESLKKKADFLSYVKTELPGEFEVVRGRAEEVSKLTDYNMCFDFCIPRAVADLSKLAGYCLPFLKKGGLLVAMKGGECSDEMRRAEPMIRKFKGNFDRAIPYSLPNGDARTLILIRKI